MIENKLKYQATIFLNGLNAIEPTAPIISQWMNVFMYKSGKSG